MQDYTSRIHTLQTFVKDVKGLVEEECHTLSNIVHGCVSESPTTRLEYLNVLCDDLRIHSKHWDSVKQALHNNKWLRRCQGSVWLEMDRVCRVLRSLRDSALWWIDKLIKVGLQVLAHADPEQLTHEVLWNITRGLEEYNAIVAVVKLEATHYSKCNIQSCCKDVSRQKTVFCSSQSAAHVGSTDPLMINSLRFLGESVRPMPFLRVLNILSNERSKYPAIMTHRFLTASSDFLELIYSNKIPDYVWDCENQHSNASLSQSGEKNDSANCWRNGQTSDYHSASTASLSATMLRVGNMRAPDLSREMSPVIEFARREHEFASRFLQIVCHSTGLLKRPPSAASKRKNAPKTGVPPRSNNNRPSVQHRTSNVTLDEDTRSLNDPRRKTVSWGDAFDDSLRVQLTERYMDLLWQNFGSNLWNFFQEHGWGSRDSSSTELGHLSLCPDTVVMLLIRMMKQLCAKGQFVRIMSDIILGLYGGLFTGGWCI